MLTILEELHSQGMDHLIIHNPTVVKEKASQYQAMALRSKTKFLNYLLEHQLASGKELAQLVAQHCGLPLIDLDSVHLDQIPLMLVNEHLIRLHRIVPLFRKANYLVLALDDPDNQEGLKEVQFYCGLQTQAVIVETDKLNVLLEKILQKKEKQGLLEALNDSIELQEVSISASDDAPLIKYVNQILLEAIKKKASDIHFESYETAYRIRYRQDGLLVTVATPPISLANRISARIKVMANLDISERRLPQDGRFKMNFSSERSIDLRISTCPTVAGEKVVIRILDPEINSLGIEALGFNEQQKTLFLSKISKPQGLILVTGPTGSGKTITLYSALNLLNTDEQNIITIEDPVEIKMPGINQVQINPKIDLSFSKALRSFLRQDPDIIMVGEIRDAETAEIAIRAAQTGHLVLSTLHTNSAAETLTRLINMGISSLNLASSLSLLVAQRLARRLCNHCKQVTNNTSLEQLINLGYTKADTETLVLYQARGCKLCSKGYLGRIGLFEVLPLTKSIIEVINAGGNAQDINEQAKNEGMMTLFQSGLENIKQGLTTIEELYRVTVDWS